MTSLVPVRQPATGETRNVTSAAASSGVPGAPERDVERGHEALAGGRDVGVGIASKRLKPGREGGCFDHAR